MWCLDLQVAQGYEPDRLGARRAVQVIAGLAEEARQQEPVLRQVGLVVAVDLVAYFCFSLFPYPNGTKSSPRRRS